MFIYGILLKYTVVSPVFNVCSSWLLVHVIESNGVEMMVRVLELRCQKNDNAKIGVVIVA